MAFRALACAEFPNDNPELHGGAIWYCAALVGPPVCMRPPELPGPALVEEQVSLEPPAEEAGFEAVVEAVEPVVEPPTSPTPPVLEADDADDDLDFEIVDDLPIVDPIDESPALPEALAASAAPGMPAMPLAPEPDPADDGAAREPCDPFATFVAVVEDVARAAGAGIEATSLLGAILGRARMDASATEADRVLRTQAVAWQAILRGESEDFASCGGGMLDEWTAALVAHVLGSANRAHGTDGLKRELRRHGVAAFGLVEQAA